MNDIEQAIETLRKISNIETQHNYEELHKIKSFNYDLLTAIEALQEKSERDKELEMFKNGDLVFSNLSDDATISVLKQWVGEKEVKDKLIKILEKEQEREKGCEICKDIIIGKKLSDKSLHTLELKCHIRDNYNYCPFCGRKLRR